MGGRSSPHRSSRVGPSSSSTPGSEYTGAPSGTGTRPGQPAGTWESGHCGAAFPIDAGFGPEAVRALPRGRAGVIGALAFRARLAGTGGLEARAARAAVACPGRTEAPTLRLRRQRGGPGSVRLAGGRGYGAGVRAATGARPGGGALLMGIRRRSGRAQEPSGWGCDAGPGIVVGGGLVGCSLGVGLRK